MVQTINTYTDKQLLDLLQNGDQEAFVAIYDKYWESLLVFVMRAIRVQFDAEDIVQELFVSLWKRRATLDIHAELSTYLYNSARYLSIRYIEKNIIRTQYLESLGKKDGHASPADQRILLQEINTRIKQAVLCMPLKMQKVFRLSREQHLSYREIAAQLNISEETVRKQIYKALKYLRSQVSDMPFAILYVLSLMLF
ncbi:MULTISPECIES: RNA polymerase sigma factor [Chitinophagaceae]